MSHFRSSQVQVGSSGQIGDQETKAPIRTAPDPDPDSDDAIELASWEGKPMSFARNAYVVTYW